jgi:hypothetical protein
MVVLKLNNYILDVMGEIKMKKNKISYKKAKEKANLWSKILEFLSSVVELIKMIN